MGSKKGNIMQNANFLFLVQSALLGWLWGLPAAKELRHYGAMALWRYGPMALWPYGAKV